MIEFFLNAKCHCCGKSIEDVQEYKIEYDREEVIWLCDDCAKEFNKKYLNSEPIITREYIDKPRDVNEIARAILRGEFTPPEERVIYKDALSEK